MATEPVEAPKPKTRKQVIPYVPPAAETLVAVNIKGMTVYHSPIPAEAENEAGARRITFYSSDRMLLQKKNVNLPAHLEPEEIATVMRQQLAGFLAKLAAGHDFKPPVEYEEVPLEDEPETPAPPAGE